PSWSPMCSQVTERASSAPPAVTPTTISPPSSRIAVIHPSEKATAFVTPPFDASSAITPTIVHGVSALRIVSGRRSRSSWPIGDRYCVLSLPAMSQGQSLGHVQTGLSEQCGAGADDVQRRAAGAREVRGARREPALLDPGDRRRELGLELGEMLAAEDGR